MPKLWLENYSLCLIPLATNRCARNCRQSRINWVNPVLPGAPLRRFCNSFPAEWKFLCVSTRVSPPTMQFPKDFPEDPSKMRKIKFACLSLATVVFLAMLFSTPLRHVGAQKSGNGDGSGGRLTYPATKKVDQVDDYFGTKVPDPYRWLENNDSAEVAAWVEAENKVTFAYLDKIPYRSQLKDRLTKLLNYPKYSSPSRRGEWFVFSKNDGLQNQNVYYIEKGLDGTPELLLDPNKFSADGTSRLGSFSLSHTGKYVGYGISEGGSDWNEIYVLDVATKKALSDHLEWVKFSGASWKGDEGFYYNRYPMPAEGKKMAAKNEFQKVYYHKIGTPQSEDLLIYEDNQHPGQFNGVGISDDQRFEFLSHSDSTTGKKGNSVFFRDLSKNEKTFTPIVAEIGDDEYGVIDNVGDKFLMQTNHNAPNGKVVLYD